MPEEVGITIKVTEDGTLLIEKTGEDFEEVGKQAKKSNETTQKAFKKTNDVLDKSNKKTKNLISSMISFKSIIASVAGAAGLGLLIRGFSKALQVSNQFENALLGLSSVTKSLNLDVNTATKAAQDLASDGLITVAEASNSLKNLLLRGFGLDQAITIMERFKDIGAFTRQGQLQLGEAIVGATQGLKSQLSILVDNIGLTKNISQIWKEYAKNIDIGVGSLTKAQKVQGEYIGILRETNPFVGDAAKLSSRFSGAVSRLNASIKLLNKSVGDQLKPEMQKLTSTLNNNVISLTGWINKSNAVGKSATVIGSTFKILSDILFVTESSTIRAANAMDQLGQQITDTAFKMLGLGREMISITTFSENISKIIFDFPGFVEESVIKDLEIVNFLLKKNEKALQRTFISPRILLGEESPLAKQPEKEAPVIPINAKTAKIRQRIALETANIIAGFETDLTNKLKIQSQIKLALFKQTEKDQTAIALFENQLKLKDAIAIAEQRIIAEEQGIEQELKGRKIVNDARIKFEEETKKTSDKRQQIALETVNILSNTETDLANRLNIQLQVKLALFKQTETDQTAIALFESQLRIQNAIEIAEQETLIRNASNEQAIKGQQIVDAARRKFVKQTTDAVIAGLKQEEKGARIVAQAKIDFDKQQADDKITQTQRVSSTLSFLANSALAQNKKTFIISKAANIAIATMNTFTAATEALKIPGIGFAAAAAVKVAGLANVAKIASTSFGGTITSGTGNVNTVSSPTTSNASATTNFQDITNTETRKQEVNIFIDGVLLESKRPELARLIDPFLKEAQKDVA